MNKSAENVMRQVMVAGNWKMNGSSESVKELMAGITAGMSSVTKAEVVVCPPAVYISRVSGAADGSAVKVGSQNICDEDSGAFTGELSGDMLMNMPSSVILSDVHCMVRLTNWLLNDLLLRDAMVLNLYSASVKRWKSVNLA
jgi:hypothetical protein